MRTGSEESKSKPLKRAISGGISRTVTSPLDVIKIRFLVQLEPTSSWAALGKGGFWRGNVPALLMVMPYCSIQFMALHQFKTFVSGSSKDANHIFFTLTVANKPFLSVFLQLLYLEFTLFPTHFILVYANMRSAFVDLVKHRGFRGPYAGLTPALVEIIPYDGIQFGAHDNFKKFAMRLNRLRSTNQDLNLDSENQSWLKLYVCGLASGACAKGVRHPLDVVKKRFLIIGLPRDPKYGAKIEHHAYHGMVDALRINCFIDFNYFRLSPK
ncbi:hypothetical protein MKW94_024027 [Papaver nudicaule]|uniref:Mitochondrial carrier protein n=1 Tax=Papaver nudicaule TaxID=74823 RepID=A0AA41SDX9_PAPNU|nr:hypothetical protein [Papaver nudicaule]